MAAKEKSEKKKTEEEVQIPSDTAESADQNETAEAAEVVSEVDGLKAQLDEMKENYLRQVAEFDNFRKADGQGKEETYTFALAKCITEFLPVMDNFERRWPVKRRMRIIRKGLK